MKPKGNILIFRPQDIYRFTLLQAVNPLDCKQARKSSDEETFCSESLNRAF